MTITALQTKNFTHDQFQHAGNALHSLAASLARLATALWSAAMPSRQLVPTVLTARQEADQLRAMADDVQRSDPRFAQDLYAAADRHERAARSE